MDRLSAFVSCHVFPEGMKAERSVARFGVESEGAAGGWGEERGYNYQKILKRNHLL